MLQPNEVKEYHLLAFTGLDFWRLRAWSGQISTFPLLHVDTWLSLNYPMGKAGQGVFGHVKAGNSGRGSAGLTDLDILFGPGDVIWANLWAHNMQRTPYDLHFGYEIWLE